MDIQPQCYDMQDRRNKHSPQRICKKSAKTDSTAVLLVEKKLNSSCGRWMNRKRAIRNVVEY
ncbi:hypothetical protein T09_8011 [Trichinella sp. T9]|nr:hypothetical protein T09_8011 [Trichinella sp. T9]